MSPIRARSIATNALAALALALVGCRSSVNIIDIPGDGRELARRGSGDGALVWRLKSGGGEDSPKLIRDRHLTRSLTILPVRAADIDKDRAARLGVEAWKGVLIERVDGESNLAKADLRKGDVLLSVNGHAPTSAKQLRESIESKLTGSDKLTLEILRGEGDPRTWKPLRIESEPDVKVVHETETESFRLETSRKVERSTGLRLAEMPAERSKEVFETERQMLLVADVIPGSPAYLAGFRPFDRIERAGGGEVTAAAEVEARVESALAAGETVSLAASDGRGGTWAADVEPTVDLDSRSEFTFPILWCHRDDVDTYEWTFLRFIFLFGADYERTYVRSDRRLPTARTEFAMLPLGLFEIDSGPDETEVSVLWFIDWSWSN